MTNIVATSLCNRRCAYCFAGNQDIATHMDRRTFLRTLELLKRSQVRQVRLLGGEPSLHPEITWMIEESLGNGLDVQLFTNGLLSSQLVTYFGSIPDDKLTILINTQPHETIEKSEKKIIERCFTELASKITLGFNISSPANDPTFLLELIDCFSLRKKVRLGIAHPSVAHTNQYLHPSKYLAVGETVANFYVLARSAQVHIGFDCGFVPCMFPPAFIENNPAVAQTTGKCCGPVPDILPDGTAIYCFGLRALGSRPYDTHQKSHDIIENFKNTVAIYRQAGIFPHCTDCSRRMTNNCDGGCLATTIKRFHGPVTEHGNVDSSIPCHLSSSTKSRSREYHHPVTANTVGPWIIPYIDQPPAFWQDLADTWGAGIAEVYLPLPEEIMGSGRPTQPSRFVDDFLRTTPFPVALVANSVVLPAPLDDFFRSLQKALKRCCYKQISSQ